MLKSILENMVYLNCDNLRLANIELGGHVFHNYSFLKQDAI